MLLAVPVAVSADRTRRATPPPRPLADAPWSANLQVNDDAGTAGQYFPSIAVDADGNAYAVWQDYRAGDADIYFSYRPAGSLWGADVKVNDDSAAATQLYPSIAVDASGNAYAVWQDHRDGDADVYFSYRPTGGSWDANVEVNDDPGTAGQYGPSIAVDPAGNVYAVWQDKRNGNNDIYFSYHHAGGSWGTNVKVNDDAGTARQEYPTVTVDPDGNAYTAWQDGRNGNSDIYFSYCPHGGSWGANAKVNDDPGTAEQFAPSIVVDYDGNAYAVWWDARNGNWDIYFSRRPAGGLWGANTMLNDDAGTSLQHEPSIALDHCGNAYAVWQDWRNGDMDIYSSHRSVDGLWAANVKVNDDGGTANQMFPTVAVDHHGKAYAVWGDGRNVDYDIYCSDRQGELGSLGDLAWDDADRDGIQDGGEHGMQDILVTVHQDGACMTPSLATDTTDADGSYLFTCLPAGTYCVEFSNVPHYWSVTLQSQGSDESVDSDADPATAQIQNIVLAPGTGEYDEDVGLCEWRRLYLPLILRDY